MLNYKKVDGLICTCLIGDIECRHSWLLKIQFNPLEVFIYIIMNVYTENKIIHTYCVYVNMLENFYGEFL
jgi:hypothetical protein